MHGHPVWAFHPLTHAARGGVRTLLPVPLTAPFAGVFHTPAICKLKFTHKKLLLLYCCLRKSQCRIPQYHTLRYANASIILKNDNQIALKNNTSIKITRRILLLRVSWMPRRARLWRLSAYRQRPSPLALALDLALVFPALRSLHHARAVRQVHAVYYGRILALKGLRTIFLPFLS